MEAAVPLAVAVPLVAAAGLLGAGPWLGRRTLDAIALAVAVATVGLCAAATAGSLDAPLVHWFGGWRPRGDLAIGIAFHVDPLSGGIATLAAALVGAMFVYTWRYFEAAGWLFHVLVLVLLASMIGFAWTTDLFNLFVFLELMSVSAYALTGHKIEATGPLQGAIHFAVTNTIGGLLVLLGIALLYGRTGALNLAQIGTALAGSPADALVAVAWALVIAGLLVKAAIVPFHFWLADAYGVAPSPACAVFSGVMIELGLYAVARVHWTAFAGSFAGGEATLSAALLAFGAGTAVVGAVQTYDQRDLKRMLGFAAVAHGGLFLIGVATLDPRGLAGVALFVLAHAFVNSSLFLAAGALLHRFGTVDELELAGRGRSLPVIGLVFLLGGLAFVGLPPLGTHTGKVLIDDAARAAGLGWVPWVGAWVGALTGAAVLRAAGRVFLGLGAPGDVASGAPQRGEEARETAASPGRPPPVLLVPAAALALATVAVGLLPGLERAAEAAAHRFQRPDAYAAAVLGGEAVTVEVPPAPPPPTGWPTLAATAGLAAAVTGVALARDRFRRRRALVTLERLLDPPLAALHRVHSGRIGDYVTWLLAGFVGLAAAALAAVGGGYG